MKSAGADGTAPAAERGPEATVAGRPYRYWPVPAAFAGESPVAAGVTAASSGADFGLLSVSSAAELVRRVRRLADQFGAEVAALPRQVHGTAIAEVHGRERGVLFPGEADGLVTSAAGALLVVTVADCVPVFLRDPEGGALGLVHAGWRGTADGVLAAGLQAMERLGARVDRLRVHLGPAICGECYEVGGEVFAALGRGGRDGGTLDLRGEIASRARRQGVAEDRLTASDRCTRCGSDQFYSYRGNATTRRMAAFLGRRASRAEA